MSIERDLDLARVTAIPVASVGCEFVEFIFVDLNEIYEEPMTDTNSVRTKTHDISHIHALSQSLTTGIHYSSLPPVLRRENYTDPNGRHYKYVLVDGHHRLEAMRALGLKRWIFAIYKFGLDSVSFEDSIRTLQLRLNDHAPTLSNSNRDIINMLSRMITQNSGLVKNEEDSIRDYIDFVCKNLHHATKGAIVKQVIAANGAYQDVVTYTAEKAYGWIRENTDYEFAGNLDAKRRQYGWTVLEGYEYEYLFNAAKKFHETGRESYFLCHTKPPTKKFDLNSKRGHMVDQFNYLESTLKSVFEFYQENDRFPWHTEAFLPQDHKANEKSVIVPQ
jgi:hypothetical protein